MGLTLSEIPSFSLIQEYVCSKQHGGADPEVLTAAQCQTISVNREANLVQMLSIVTTTVPPILTALFYGSMTDNWGRRRTMKLSIAGILIFQALSLGLTAAVPYIPVEAVSLAGIALFLGGGVGVAEATVFTIISDVSSQRWRTIYFQIVICTVLVAEIVGAVASPFLMRESAWSPLYVGLAFNAAGFLLLFILPETLDRKRSGTEPNFEPRPTPDRSSLWRLKAVSCRQAWKSSKTACKMMGNANISLLLPAAALTLPLATTSGSLLSRIAPLRYNSTFETSSSLVAIRAAVNIFVLAVCQPILVYLWRGDSSFRRDILFAGILTVPLFAGMFAIAASPSMAEVTVGLVIFTIGAAVPGLARAVLVQMVEREHLGIFFGLLAVIEQMGFLMLGLLLSGLFDVALNRGGGVWLGLPLYAAGCMFTISALCLWLARPVPRGEDASTGLPNMQQPTLCSERHDEA